MQMIFVVYVLKSLTLYFLCQYVFFIYIISLNGPIVFHDLFQTLTNILLLSN